MPRSPRPPSSSPAPRPPSAPSPNTNVSLVDAAMPGHAAGDQRLLRRAGGPHRPRAEGEDQPLLALRPQELLLPGPAAGLPDQPALPPDRRRGRGARRPRARASPAGSAIDHIHLEQDAGKSIHDLDPDLSFVDLNRTGVALMEIVSMPDIRSPEEAAEYVRKLRQILRYLGTCDGNMQEGNLRADVNVSVRPKGVDRARHPLRDQEHELDALHHARRSSSRRSGRSPSSRTAARVEQETRLYDPNAGETRSMRSKEEAHDYRYFPDPDLLPLELEQAWIDAIAATCPSCPDAKKARFVTDYGMTEYDAGVLTAETAERQLLRGRGAGPRRQAGGELGDQRALRPPEQGGPRRRGEPGRPGAARRPDRPRRPPARSPARSPRTSSRFSGPKAAIRRQSSPSAACAR